MFAAAIVSFPFDVCRKHTEHDRSETFTRAEIGKLCLARSQDVRFTSTLPEAKFIALCQAKCINNKIVLNEVRCGYFQ